MSQQLLAEGSGEGVDPSAGACSPCKRDERALGEVLGFGSHVADTHPTHSGGDEGCGACSNRTQGLRSALPPLVSMVFMHLLMDCPTLSPLPPRSVDSRVRSASPLRRTPSNSTSCDHGSRTAERELRAETGLRADGRPFPPRLAKTCCWVLNYVNAPSPGERCWAVGRGSKKWWCAA